MPQPDNPHCFENLVTYKIADTLSNEHIDPNYITILNIFPSALALYYIYNDNFPMFTIFLTIHIILDALDGHIARKYNKVSKIGHFLDCTLDTIFWSILLFMLLNGKINFGILFLIIISFIVVIQGWSYVPIMSEIFEIMHDNAIILAPLVSYCLYKLQKY
jgi:phosphatidylglycerophosphate synthase